MFIIRIATHSDRESDHKIRVMDLTTLRSIALLCVLLFCCLLFVVVTDPPSYPPPNTTLPRPYILHLPRPYWDKATASDHKYYCWRGLRMYGALQILWWWLLPEPPSYPILVLCRFIVHRPGPVLVPLVQGLGILLFDPVPRTPHLHSLLFLFFIYIFIFYKIPHTYEPHNINTT